MTASRMMKFTPASVQMVELNRPFITSSQDLKPSNLLAARFRPVTRTAGSQKLNHTYWKRFQHALQIKSQRQAIFVAQHATAVRHVARRFINQQRLAGRVRADDLIGGNS